MTEKKNSAQKETAAKTGQGDSLQRPNMYVPEGFEEKLQKGKGATVGQGGKPKADTDRTGEGQKSQPRGKKAGKGTSPAAPAGGSKAASKEAAGKQRPKTQRSGQQGKTQSRQLQTGTTAAAQQKGQPAQKQQPKNQQQKDQQAKTQQPKKQQPKAQQAKTQQPAKNQPAKNQPQPKNQPQRNNQGKSQRATQKPKQGEAGGQKRRGQTRRKPPVKIISLGGLGEIGKNITVYETEQDILVVDCGLAFPDEDMLGIDLVIPDFTYLERNKEKIRGIFITHGHEDHIGSLTYLLKKVQAPVYATALTAGLIQGKLKEHGLFGQAHISVVRAGDTVTAGGMSVEFIRVNHSIPDACALAINTPAGVIIQTGDFKIDYTPINSEVIDLGRFGELGSKGVLALLCDSTNAEKPGSTASERIVGASFDKLFQDAVGKRVIVATFASNVYRVQQIIDVAVRTGRKVAVFGRSMLNMVAVATELGYLNAKEGTIIDIDQINNYTDDQLVVICTGSQGETMSALTRMSMGDHRQVHIGHNDYIIISATPIPGNEKLVGKVVNDLMKLGADVIYERMYDVHVSGHACADEIKTMISLTRPKYFVPVHGEYKHLVKNAGIAKSMGIPDKNIIVTDIGKVMETDGVEIKITGQVPAGRVMVDGSGVGDVGSIVLRDRKLLSEEGLIVVVASIDSATGEIVAGPDLVSRGFVYVRESEELMTEAREVALKALKNSKLTGFKDWSAIKNKVRDDMSEFMFNKTRRRPMILPIIQEV